MTLRLKKNNHNLYIIYFLISFAFLHQELKNLLNQASMCSIHMHNLQTPNFPITGQYYPYRMSRYALTHKIIWSRQYNSPKTISSKRLHIGTSITLSLTTTKFKLAKIPRNIIELKFPGMCTSTHCVLNIYRVSLNSLQWFKRSFAYKLFITTCIFNIHVGPTF